MTAVDHGAAQTAIPQQATGPDGTRPAGPAGSAAAASAAAIALPRDPQERLAALFDPGTLEILPVETEERGGVVAGVGLVHGANVVAFASDPRVGQVKASVTNVTFTSPTTANVTYDLSLQGQVVQPNAAGQAVLDNGVWKVSKSTLCGLVQLSGNSALPGCS